MAVSKNQVGFECEFVEDPPQWLQIECPVCLQILHEPYQVTCCGKSFCKQCIERVKADHKPCPCCKQDNFNDFPNKGLQQPLYGFKVYCANKENGCEWTGELGQLDIHLNLNPSNDNQLEGCNFAKINCDYCSDLLMRSKLLHHKNELCDKRPFSCEHCNDYLSSYEDVIHNHWPVCGHHPVRCPSECGAFPQRQNLESHVAKECPLTVVECEFHYAGCEVRLPRKDMPDHLKDDLITHFTQLAVSHKRQQGEIKVYQEEIKALIKNEIKALEKRHQEEIKALTKEVDGLKKQLSLDTQSQIVENPAQYQHPLKWYSKSFYSHIHGYKLCLGFYKFARYTITCDLMQGEFDGLLIWPLQAVMTIALQSPHGDDHKMRIKLKYEKRIVGVHTGQCGATVIGSNLSPYLRNNSLHIRIVSIQF